MEDKFLANYLIIYIKKEIEESFSSESILVFSSAHPDYTYYPYFQFQPLDTIKDWDQSLKWLAQNFKNTLKYHQWIQSQTGLDKGETPYS